MWLHIALHAARHVVDLQCELVDGADPGFFYRIEAVYLLRHTQTQTLVASAGPFCPTD
jgi:hypothetical protein